MMGSGEWGNVELLILISCSIFNNRLSGLFCQRVNLIVGWAGEPVHKKLIENGAIYKIIDLDFIIPIQPETILTSETFKKSHPFLGGGIIENY